LCNYQAIMFKLNLSETATSLRTGSRPRKKGGGNSAPSKLIYRGSRRKAQIAT
jgi:hypothetical protein